MQIYKVFDYKIPDNMLKIVFCTLFLYIHIKNVPK